MLEMIVECFKYDFMMKHRSFD